MDHKRFVQVMEGQFESSRNVLANKAREYATDVDRLHNFKVAADLQGNTPMEALGGMLAKHIVSVYDLISAPNPTHLDVWDEKLGDAINYLILLKAMVVDQHEQEVHAQSEFPIFAELEKDS